MPQPQQQSVNTPSIFRQRSRSGSLVQTAVPTPSPTPTRLPFSGNLVLFDISMPTMDRLKILEEIQSQQPGFVIINFTAPAATSANPVPKKNAELTWLREHNAEVSNYKGQWLLLSGETLLARNEDFAQIRAAITANGISSPFVYYVPTDDESTSLIL